MTRRSMTVPELLAHGAAIDPAIGAPGQSALSYGDLRTLIASSRDILHKAGLGRGDRIATVMPNGPDMASLFLAITASAVAAPLNPAYQAEELRFYLADLKASALVVPLGESETARNIAQELSIPVIELVRDGERAGLFTLQVSQTSGRTADTSDVQPGDTALILHTSGTTARPKIVPLTQANLAASARHIGQTLALSTNDICLNIMPLFHIHGLIAAVLSTLAAGGCVVCTPGFNGFRFFTWLGQARPTWFTGVPTMLQTLLELVPRFANIIADGRLRLIRSSSASLPAPVMSALEQAFGVPVIEAYGMTEATHQMASNPLPPHARFPGSVGIAAGPEIAILGEDGTLLPAGEIGEVVIRGPNVTAGYEANPDANAKSFVDGWFRTGDQGALDERGYLRLTGRLKEIINRAGEKVSPLELDAILLEHPAVEQAVSFAVPSRLFGEDVGAAVVLRSGHEVDEEGLRRFVADRAAAFKIPKQVVFLSEIPKGATGKIQRVGLAKKLGLGDQLV